MNDGEEAEATRRSDGAMEGREGEEGEEGVGKETLGDGTDGVEGEGEQEHAGIDRKDEVEMQGGTLAGDESVWRGKLPQVEPNKEEEFDDYFRGMFLWQKLLQTLVVITWWRWNGILGAHDFTSEVIETLVIAWIE